MIIGIAGKKKSGKDTIADYLSEKFDYEVYHYADPLKEFCRDYLGLDEKLLWGSDEDKNTLTKYKFGDLANIGASIVCPKYKNKLSVNIQIFEYCELDFGKFMTCREILQYFGSEVFRAFDNNIWIDTTFRRIRDYNSEKAVIADVRFLDEVKAIEDAGGAVIRLSRKGMMDKHQSETALDNHKFKYLIDNQNQTLEETFSEVDHVMYKIANRDVWDKIESWKMSDEEV